MPGSTTPLVRGSRGSVSVDSSGIGSPGQEGASQPSTPWRTPVFPGGGKPLKTSGDRDGPLHHLRMVLAVELVAAGRRRGEGHRDVLAALHVLVRPGLLEGEVVLDGVVVGHLDAI